MYNYIPIFEPNVKSPGPNTVSLATYNLKDKKIRFHLGSWKYNYGLKPSYSLYRRFIHALSHEVIHSVIFKLLEQDRYNGQIDPEWPEKYMDLYTGKNHGH